MSFLSSTADIKYNELLYSCYCNLFWERSIFCGLLFGTSAGSPVAWKLGKRNETRAQSFFLHKPYNLSPILSNHLSEQQTLCWLVCELFLFPFTTQKIKPKFSHFLVKSQKKLRYVYSNTYFYYYHLGIKHNRSNYS